MSCKPTTSKYSQGFLLKDKTMGLQWNVFQEYEPKKIDSLKVGCLQPRECQSEWCIRRRTKYSMDFDWFIDSEQFLWSLREYLPFGILEKCAFLKDMKTGLWNWNKWYCSPPFLVVVMVEGHSLIKWFEQIAVFWLLRIITPLKKMDKNNQLLSFIFPWVGFASFCEMQFKELFNGVTTCPFILSHTLPIFSAWQPVREVILNSFIGFGGTQRTIEMKMEFSRGCLHRRPRRAVTTVPTLNHWTDEEKRRYISPIN